MGAGSSKANDENTRGSSSQKPVANVNNNEGSALTGYPQRNVGNKKTDTRDILTDKANVDYNSFNRDAPIPNIPESKKDKGKEKKEKKNAKTNNKNVSALTYENDSDIEDDIDAVLKIPMAADFSKSKDKKKKKEKSQNEENETDNENERWNDRRGEIDEPLPETYAQRLQRKQYKLQQEMLIREKTIMRNSYEWDRHDDDEMDVDSPRKGFDPSKFRAVNKGQDSRKELFTAVRASDEFKTPRYLQTTGQDLDDVDFRKGQAEPEQIEPIPRGRLPSYNQSELNLMNELEQELF